MEAMKKQGVNAVFGRWLIEGYPNVLLFDMGSVYHRLDEWKHDLWCSAKIPAPPGDRETNDAVVFGHLVAWFLAEASIGIFLLVPVLTKNPSL